MREHPAMNEYDDFATMDVVGPYDEPAAGHGRFAGRYEPQGQPYG